MGKKLFDYVIGNPPYQEETESDSTRKPPIYNIISRNLNPLIYKGFGFLFY